jgi:hypothetical protein
METKIRVFRKKPNRGGTPANEKRRRERDAAKKGLLVNSVKEVNVLNEVGITVKKTANIEIREKLYTVMYKNVTIIESK